MAQQLVEKRGLDKHDPWRTARMAGYGGLIFGPAATTWYGVLTKYVNTSSKNGTIVARVACDQLLFAPVNMGTWSYCLPCCTVSLSRPERRRSGGWRSLRRGRDGVVCKRGHPC